MTIPNLTITDTAKSQFNKIGGTIRYSLNSGGCSGLIGKWDNSTMQEGDMVVWSNNNATFVIDNVSLTHLINATFDFSSDAFAPAFSVQIPGKGSCGCGESFVL